MQWIDEDGKIFGFINIFDLLALVLVIAAFSIVGVKVLRQPGQTVTPAAAQGEELYVTVVCRLVPEETALNLSQGDQCVDSNSYVKGEVHAVSYEPAVYVSVNEEGESVLAAHPTYKDVTVVLKTTGDSEDPIVSIGGSNARIGSNYTVKTQKVEMQGVVIGVEFVDIDNPE